MNKNRYAVSARYRRRQRMLKQTVRYVAGALATFAICLGFAMVIVQGLGIATYF